MVPSNCFVYTSANFNPSIKVWMRIFVDTVSTNKNYAVDTVSTNKSYAVDTVSTNKSYAVDTVSTNKNYAVDTLGAPCTKEHFALKVNFELKVHFVL